MKVPATEQVHGSSLQCHCLSHCSESQSLTCLARLPVVADTYLTETGSEICFNIGHLLDKNFQSP